MPERMERISRMSKHLGSLALVPVVICGLAVSRLRYDAR